MTVSWEDYEAVARLLVKAYPKEVPVRLNAEDIKKKVLGLKEFSDKRSPTSGLAVSAIQKTWIKLSRRGTTSGYEDESML